MKTHYFLRATLCCLFPILTAAAAISFPTSDAASPSQQPMNDAAEPNFLPHAQPQVVTGAEQLNRLLPLLQGKRTALVVNQTSLVGKTHLLDTLLTRGIQVIKVFAPEHGFRGQADAGENVSNGRDTRTHTPLISLYGRNKKPTPAQLADVDIVVFDIQDVGARFYTYISTLHYVMEACAEQHKPLIITDRPNPCDYIDGPIRLNTLKSFVSLDPIPVLHGCTIGELARMINGEGWLSGKKTCKLTVIPLQGWRHGQPYSLPVKPSPNLPNDQAIALYPSLCPFEGTAISVGRGTLTPFQILGSPDICSTELPNWTEECASATHFKFTPHSLPGFDKNPMYKNNVCYGSDLRQVSAPAGLSLKYIIGYYQAYRKLGKAHLFFTRPHWFDLLLGNPNVRKQIIQGVPEKQIRAGWQKELNAYRMMREKYLIYADRTECEPNGCEE